MNIVAIIQSETDRNTFGLKNRAMEELGGKTLLEHVVRRLKKVPEISKIVLFSAKEHPLGPRLSYEYGVRCEVISLNDIPERQAILRARKWSLECWRGGAFYTLCYDEHCNPFYMKHILETDDPAFILNVPDTAVFIDPDLLSQLCRLSVDSVKKGFHFFFSQACPGLLTELYDRVMITDMIRYQCSTRSGLYYNPQSARADFILSPSNLFLERELRCAKARFNADTRRHFEILNQVWSALPDPENASAVEVVQAYNSNADFSTTKAPREIEIEITGKCNLSCTFCPRERTPRANLDMSVDDFKKVIDGLPDYDDICLTFSGYGEPLLHPQLPEMLKYAKERGVFGLHVSTNGVLLDEQMLNKLLQIDIDMVSFSMFANTPELYKKLTGVDCHQTTVDNLNRALDVRVKQHNQHLLAFPEIIKMRDVQPEIEPFFDYWYGKLGWTAIQPFNDFCGKIPDQSVIHLLPSKRSLCQKLKTRLYVYADGSVPVCGQDFAGEHPVANAFKTPLSEIWNHEKFTRLRSEHCAGKFSSFPLCQTCKDWHY